MRIVLVPDESVNTYADASNFKIGIHTGFMRSAGDDDEIAAVLAHEAAHLLFGHAQKKASNAATGSLMTGIAMGALGAAMHRPGMDTGYIGDMMEGGFNAGYLAYSPEMEIEADQFAMYVLKEASRCAASKTSERSISCSRRRQAGVSSGKSTRARSRSTVESTSRPSSGRSVDSMSRFVSTRTISAPSRSWRAR